MGTDASPVGVWWFGFGTTIQEGCGPIRKTQRAKSRNVVLGQVGGIRIARPQEYKAEGRYNKGI